MKIKIILVIRREKRRRGRGRGRGKEEEIVSKIFLLILQRRVATTTTGRAISVSQDGRIVPWGDT